MAARTKKSKLELEQPVPEELKKKKNIFESSSEDESCEEDDDQYSMGSSSEGEGSNSDESSSDDELPIEKKAKKLQAKQKLIEEESKKEAAEIEMDLVALPSGDKIRTDLLASETSITEAKERIETVRYILEDFKSRREEGKSRSEYLQQLQLDISVFYGYSTFLADLILKLFKVNEAIEFLDANETARPLVIRVNTLKTNPAQLTKALKARGANVQAIKWTNIGLQIFDSNVPIGATPEYLAGHYMQQSASSFCPVLALDAQENERVLDMCAAPGGKTTHIAQMMKNTGMLWANDVSKNRLVSLKANLHRHGVKNAIVSNYNGVLFQALTPNYFNRVLLDAPCTGTGIIAKDPSVKSSKGLSDFIECSKIQKDLILCAIDSVNAKSPNPIIVYSTCSISVQENEAIVDYALKQRHVKLVDTGLPFGTPGFVNHESGRFDPSLKLAKRYYPHTHNMDGFFVAKLKKLSNDLPKNAVQQVPTLKVEQQRLKVQKEKQRIDDQRKRRSAKLKRQEKEV